MAIRRGPEPLRPVLPFYYKWARLFRLQFAVRQTDKNRRRLAEGRPQMGRRVPRLVSVDFADLWQVPEDWGQSDLSRLAASQSPAAYAAGYMGGEYFVLDCAPDPALAQACLETGKIVVLPREGIARW